MHCNSTHTLLGIFAAGIYLESMATMAKANLVKWQDLDVLEHEEIAQGTWALAFMIKTYHQSQ